MRQFMVYVAFVVSMVENQNDFQKKKISSIEINQNLTNGLWYEWQSTIIVWSGVKYKWDLWWINVAANPELSNSV
jgi:hypothetical protein